MGSILSRAFAAYFGQKQAKILILGLDNAGKTTILFRLQLDENVETVPTLAFNVESVQYQNIKFQVWDLGGQDSIRPYWRCYFSTTAAVIFVVDSTNPSRLDAAREELEILLEEEGLENAVFMIFANKQDIPGAITPTVMSQKLELSKIKNRSWSIFGTSAANGTGISEGLDWLCSELLSNKQWSFNNVASLIDQNKSSGLRPRLDAPLASVVGQSPHAIDANDNRWWLVYELLRNGLIKFSIFVDTTKAQRQSDFHAQIELSDLRGQVCPKLAGQTTEPIRTILRDVISYSLIFAYKEIPLAEQKFICRCQIDINHQSPPSVT